jgi:ABC-type glutathione transport system ATPase component
VSSTTVPNGLPLLRADGLSKHFPVEADWLSTLRGARHYVKAVDGVTLDIHQVGLWAVVANWLRQEHAGASRRAR